MPTSTFWVRGDSITANNSTMNPLKNNVSSGSFPTTSVTFVANGSSGDVVLETNGGAADPDTLVQIGSTTYPFTIQLTGTLPSNSQVPASLVGRKVMLIVVNINGVTHELFFVLGNPPATFAEMDAIGYGAIPLGLVTTTPPPTPVCFCAGTDIATPSGLRKVETLTPGEAVLTEDGRTVQVAWTGVTKYGPRQLGRQPDLRPVRIPANAFGPGLPLRDLDVSPQHRIVVEGAECELLFGMPRAFVVARHLLGSIAHTPESDDGVEYVHLMLDAHDIVVSNGLPSESFQPARRMLDIMNGENLDRLMAALAVLGTDAMLARPDALPTMSSREAAVLLAAVKPGFVAPAALEDLASARLSQ